MSKRSIIGATVVLNRDIVTKGGVTFRAGLKMRVADSTSGGLSLYVDAKSCYESVRCVDRHAVTVLEFATKEKDR